MRVKILRNIFISRCSFQPLFRSPAKSGFFMLEWAALFPVQNTFSTGRSTCAAAVQAFILASVIPTSSRLEGVGIALADKAVHDAWPTHDNCVPACPLVGRVLAQVPQVTVRMKRRIERIEKQLA